jgi:hypothetical protein
METAVEYRRRIGVFVRGHRVTPSGVVAVAKKRSESRKMNTLVRLDDAVVEKGRKVAALKGVSLGDYISKTMRPIIDRDLAREVKKLSKEREGET